MKTKTITLNRYHEQQEQIDNLNAKVTGLENKMAILFRKHIEEELRKKEKQVKL